MELSELTRITVCGKVELYESMPDGSHFQDVDVDVPAGTMTHKFCIGPYGYPIPPWKHLNRSCTGKWAPFEEVLSVHPTLDCFSGFLPHWDQKVVGIFLWTV